MEVEERKQSKKYFHSRLAPVAWQFSPEAGMLTPSSRVKMVKFGEYGRNKSTKARFIEKKGSNNLNYFVTSNSQFLSSFTEIYSERGKG